MKWYYVILICTAVVGCSRVPSKEAHIKQVRQAIANAGGEEVVLKESVILFSRFSNQSESSTLISVDDKFFKELNRITNLGDVFFYDHYQPDRIQVRIHNSHRDTYFIELLNPSLPEPTNFERIEGNVGFIK